MQMRELVKVINTYGAKIVFDNIEEVAKRIMKGDSPLYFACVEGGEQTEYEEMNDKHNFVSTTAAIHIGDLSIEELFDTFECDGTGILEYTIDIIRPFCDGEIEQKIVFATFLFLHEVGHWFQFLRLKNNVYDYIEMDCDLEKEIFEKMSALRQKRQERIAKGIECKLTTNEKNCLDNTWKNIEIFQRKKRQMNLL